MFHNKVWTTDPFYSGSPSYKKRMKVINEKFREKDINSAFLTYKDILNQLFFLTFNPTKNLLRFEETSNSLEFINQIFFSF
jgi:hypothetical protein